MAKRTGDHFRHRQKLYHMYESVCWLCGEPNAAEIDHVIPVSQGGSDDITNLRLAHQPCNVARNQRRHKWHKAPEITESGYPTQWHDLPLTPAMWRDDFAAKARIIAAENAEQRRLLQEANDRRKAEDEAKRKARAEEFVRLTAESTSEIAALTATNDALLRSPALDHRALAFTHSLESRTDNVTLVATLIGTVLIAVAGTWLFVYGPFEVMPVGSDFGEYFWATVVGLGVGGFLAFFVMVYVSLIGLRAFTMTTRATFGRTSAGRRYLATRGEIDSNLRRISDLEREVVRAKREFEKKNRPVYAPRKYRNYGKPKTYRRSRSYRGRRYY